MSYKYRPGILFGSVRQCEYPGCDQPSVGYCDPCDMYFCSDHEDIHSSSTEFDKAIIDMLDSQRILKA